MKQQRGSALIISLLILLVMTIIGITAMSSSTMEEKMAANDRNQKAIFQNAESSLMTAEDKVLALSYDKLKENMADKVAGFYTSDKPRFDYLNHSAWKSGATCATLPANSNNSGSSCYIVEEIEGGTLFTPGEAAEYGSVPLPKLQITRVTVRSTDSNNASAVIVQSNLQKTINN
jgi:type IV pilus assembly protein PilX